jgi:hypothetical protein
MPWTGEVISEINNFLRERYDMSGVQALRVYRNPVLERVRKVATREDLYLHAGGKGLAAVLQTAAPMNTTVRTEAGDFPQPGKTKFERLVVREVQYAATTGITLEEQEEARQSESGVANLLDIKLRDLKDDLRWRLQCAVRADSTGRLGRISGVTGFVVTLNNTAKDFGWDDVDMFLPGMEVDIYRPAVSGENVSWSSVATGKVVSVVNKAAKQVTLVDGPNTTTVVAPANGDIIFLRGAVTLSGSALVYRDMAGLLYLIDDGTRNWIFTGQYASPPGSGSPRKDYFGITDRTTVPSLVSPVYSKWDGDSPGSWDLEDLLKPIRDIDSGFADGQVTAIYCHPDMAAAIARKAAAAHNATMTVNDGRVTGGYYTRQLNVEGRMVPIIPMPQGWPKYTVLGVDEDKLRLYMPQDINFVNPYTGESGNRQVFFGSPGQRNMTFEAWLRFVGQLVALRCDTSFRLDGLRTDE